MRRSLPQIPDATADEVRLRLLRVQAERLDALEAGADPGSDYLTRLQAAIDAARVTFVTQAVGEIAALRAELGARLQG